MRNRLESRLSQLKTPAAPPDLKARCLATIPADVRRAPAKTRGFGRPLSAPKLGLATLVLATAIGLAFWNTRAANDRTVRADGNAAFAQTTAAMKNVSYFRLEAQMNNWDGWYDDGVPKANKITPRIARIEADLSRGVYIERTPQTLPTDKRHLGLGGSTLNRLLYLPDDTAYARPARSSKLTIVSVPHSWAEFGEDFKKFVAGSDAPSVFVGMFENQTFEFISSKPDIWQGREVYAYLYRAELPAKAQTEKNATAVESQFLVDPKTKLVEVTQMFIVENDGSRNQILQMMFDYTRPDASVFEPARLKIGAQIVDERRKK